MRSPKDAGVGISATAVPPTSPPAMGALVEAAYRKRGFARLCDAGSPEFAPGT